MPNRILEPQEAARMMWATVQEGAAKVALEEGRPVEEVQVEILNWLGGVMFEGPSD